MTKEIDPMPKVRYGTDRWVHDSTSEKDAQDRAFDILEPDTGQSDGTPTPVI